MQIIGPDELIFGVDNLEASRDFLADYGLTDIGGDTFEALDGTAITLRARDDESLPPPLPTASMLRRTVWGVKDQATLDAIEAELSKDRSVTRTEDGVLLTKDDCDFEIAFQLTRRTRSRDE